MEKVSHDSVGSQMHRDNTSSQTDNIRQLNMLTSMDKVSHDSVGAQMLRDNISSQTQPIQHVQAGRSTNLSNNSFIQTEPIKKYLKIKFPTCQNKLLDLIFLHFLTLPKKTSLEANKVITKYDSIL